ncbi:GNAT family N-acetyltransferase [Jannaschia marina]|uniref:GNAT family N-acetyltransferase n=1 Tax=Jannaschia marina TaxID=2741674 RepID=UPI0015C83ED9|nr:GNAT family N-acetyltransferase [Jannaschia marina]
MTEGPVPQIHPGFPEDQRAVAAALYWQAFETKLGPVLGPAPRGQAFLVDILDPRFAISALHDGRLLGIAGFKTADGALTGGGWPEIARHYGTFGAAWRAALLSLIERDVEAGILLMDGICVAPAARGLGLGTQLLRAVRSEAGRRGLGRVRLDVIDGNPRARALYLREGFVPVGTRRMGPLGAIFGFRHAERMEAPAT